MARPDPAASYPLAGEGAQATPRNESDQNTPGVVQDDADLAKLKRYFAEAAFKTQDARTHSLTAIDYYDSDQYTRAELQALAERNQPPIVINRIKPAVNGIIGVVERGRSDPKAWPRNPGEEDSADAATDVLRYIADFNRFKRLKRDCFLDMLVPGTCAALIGADEDKQVTVTQIRWEEIFADPQSRRADFKDARYIGIAKWMYADDLSALYPAHREDIEATVENGIGTTGVADESYQDRPIAYSGNTGWVDRKQRRLMVVEMYYREGSWKRCVFTGASVLEAAASPYLDHKGRPECPIEAMSAYVKRDNSRYGAVWDMIGPQDEVNKRRSSGLHRLVSKQVQVRDVTAIATDIDVARKEASKPDGVLPPGFEFADNRADVAGHLEMLQEAKGEIERMGPNPAVLGRSVTDDSGRALLARQQSGLIELSNLYGALEDWELRVYRQCWGRAKQFWTAPQFIRVTDDENAPKFVGLNQPVMGPPIVGAHPVTGMPQLQPTVLGYRNRVAEMDVDIEIDTQQDVGSLQAEAFHEIVELVKISPVYQQQVSVKELIQLSPIQHKRAILDIIDEAAKAQQRQADQAHQVQLAGASAKIAETQARTGLHAATGFSKTLDSLTYAHQAHADHAASGLEKGIETANAEKAQQAAQEQAAQAQQGAGAARPPAQQQAAAGPASSGDGAQ
ncbi:MAG: portal protein [Caulobacteraceae bacterium]